MGIVTGGYIEGEATGMGRIVADAAAEAANIDAKALGLQDGVSAENKPNKVRKPRKARAASKFVVLTAEYLKDTPSYPNIVAARKGIAGSGTYLIACLREEVIVETTVPTPVTKVTVKRVAR